MNIPGFTQVPCPRCGKPVMVAQATGTGYCQCGMQVGAAPGMAPPGGMPGQMPPGQMMPGQMPGQMPPGQMMPGQMPGQMPPGQMPPGQMPGQPGQPQQMGGMGMPGMPRMPFPQMGAGGSPKMKIFGAIGGAILLMIAGGVWSAFKADMFGAGGKGNIGYGQLSIDPKKPLGDAMMMSVAGLATKWKKDAVWWGVNYQAVHSDGSVDLEKGATVTYASLSSAKSPAKSINQDSLKEFVFSQVGVNFSRMTGVVDYKQWADARPPTLPKCSISALAKELSSKGLTAGKTVRITYDQEFGGPAEPSWRVIGEDPKMDAYFSMATCQPTK